MASPVLATASAVMTASPPRIASMEAATGSTSPSLLREWSTLEEPQEALIVAPAVVLPVPCCDDEDDGKPAAVYPIATFVTNLVRTGMEHIYAGIAEAVDADPINSVRSEATMEAIRSEIRRGTRSESDLFLPNNDEYVLIDGDLVAIPSPPPNNAEQDELDFQQRQSSKNRMRRSMRGLRKWMKRRQHGKKESTPPPPALPPVKSSTVARKMEKQRRLSNRRARSMLRDQESTTVWSEPPPLRAQAPSSSNASVASADYIGIVGAESSSIGNLRNLAAAVAFIETEDDEKALKVDKVDEVQLDSMLQQAIFEVEQDYGLEDCIGSLPPAKTCPSNHPCPLSTATTDDDFVVNDALKVIMMGDLSNEKSLLARAIGGKKPKRPRSTLGVDVHTWTPKEGLAFTIWDVSSVCAGSHPSTQGLFFSAESLYVLVWDLGVANKMTHRTKTDDDDEYDNENEDDNDNDFLREQQQRQADRALQHDIEDHVLAWLERIIPHGSAVLPVACLTAEMNESEVQRRCSILQTLLVNHPAFCGDNAPKLIFGKNDNVLMVNLASGVGLPELQETVLAIGQERVFAHVGSEVNHSTMQILETIRRLKQDHKVITVDHLMAEMNGPTMKIEVTTEALQFLSSIGEILYFGSSTDEILSRYVILSRKWLVSALSCILRPDLQRELVETRRFMNLQCVYSGDGFVESDTVQTLLKGTNSSCPILSAKDSAMLWKSMSFMREAADRTAQLSVTSNTMYDFLERLLVYSGILLPLNVATEPTYFVPSLLDLKEPSDVWRYKTSDAWMTTLCHSWLLQDGAPSNMMEHVTTNLLQDLYEFSHTFHGQLSRPLIHSRTVPIGSSALNEFLVDHDQEPIGRIKINQVMCWKSSVLVKIGSVIADSDQRELRESIAEIYIAVVGDQSKYCVDTKSMRNGTKRLIVCGKGQVGRHGRKLWKGGYGLVLDSIKASLADTTGADRQVVCPECLAHSHPSVARTWSWDYVQITARAGDPGIRCASGHRVDTNLLCGHGVCPSTVKPAPPPSTSPRVSKPVKSLLRSVVLVGLWDSQQKRIQSVGSGFIVDQALGLVVTAKHILFNMDGRNGGARYLGLDHGKAVIGVIPDGGETAVFRYFAEIVSHGGHNLDACVLKLTTRMVEDVIGEGEGCAHQPERPVSGFDGVPALPMTSKFELEESVRIIGFNQGGEGVLEKGQHLNRSADFAKGYICKKFKASLQSDDENSDSCSSMSTTKSFSPLEEIVVICPTISGHSGGPCVNGEGNVVGILSRADRDDYQRCYLVPSSELKKLVRSSRRI